ncbi:MAG: hypothetical protein HYV15_05345 [Elusimicrobia bacterium]|nr:hypothetical protein [Elusimicrobiota bacterium]
MALTVEAETLAMMYLRAISAGEPALLPADEMARVKEKLAAYVAQGAPRPPAAP